MDAIGFIGGTITSLGGIPQIYKIISTKQANDISWIMLGSWFIGLSLTAVYAFSINALPVILNSVISLTNTVTIIFLKFYFAQASEYEVLHPSNV